MTETVDVIIIGAGVVGLAVGRALAKAGRDVIVLERHGAFGTESSSRNSQVIHAGIQYHPDSVRASLAVKGRHALYEFCQNYNVDHLRCGKMLVANGDDEVSRLLVLKTNAEKNGVNDLCIISSAEARQLEPGIRCDGAIVSPSSGLVDSHGLMLALLGELENAGGALALGSPVEAGAVSSGKIELTIGGSDPVTLRAKTVVNCAGLFATEVARSISGVPPESVPKLYFGKGQYFTYSGAAPFQRLIYPLPSRDSQGIHYTRDLGGQAKLGPDIEFVVSNTDYTIDELRKDAFAAAARRFWPDLNADRLVPGYTGIRPKIAGPGKEGDFIIQAASDHGVAGYIGLYGIESPGLTTCLAIADRVSKLAD